MNIKPAELMLTHEDVAIAVIEWLERQGFKRAGAFGDQPTKVMDDVRFMNSSSYPVMVFAVPKPGIKQSFSREPSA
jgi:hypothetical protein